MSENFHEQQERVPWSGTDLIFLFVLTLTLVFGLSEIINWIFLRNLPLELRDAVLGLITTLLQDLLLVGLSMILIARRYTISLRRMFFQVQKWTEVIINGIAGGVIILSGVLLVNLILAILLMRFFDYTPPQQRVITLLLQSENIWLFLAYAVLIVLIAPFVEELFFRGLVFSYFRGRYGVRGGILVSSFFFGIVHMSMWAFTGTFLGGVALAVLFERSKTLYTPILAHMVWNGIVTILLYLSWQFGDLPIQVVSLLIQ